MPRILGVGCQQAIRALQRLGFGAVRQGKHVVMSNGIVRVTTPSSNPINAYTMGGIAADAGLTPEEFRKPL